MARGFGILLARSRLVAATLSDRRLTLLSDRADPLSYRYYALRQRGADSRLPTQFLDWLTGEIEAEDAALIFDAAASMAQGVGVPLRPDKPRLPRDVDRRGEERLVGQSAAASRPSRPEAVRRLLSQGLAKSADAGSIAAEDLNASNDE